MSNDNQHWLVEKLDVWIPAILGLGGLITLLFLAQGNPAPSLFQLRIYLVVLAISAAAFAAIIPGLLHVKITLPGIALRAAGALAVFCVVFFYEPAQKSLAKGLGVPIPESIPLTFDSGWRGGGSSPAQYCTRQKESVQIQYPDREVKIVDTTEDHKSEYTPFKHDYYRYTCFLVVETTMRKRRD